MENRAERMSWSTAEVAESDAFAYWIDVVCDALVHAAVRPTGEAPFTASIEHVALEGIGFTTAASGPQQVTRTKRQIATSRDELLLVNIQTAGRSLVRQDGRSARLLPGNMTFLDSTRPYSLEYSEPSSLVVVQIPHALLPGRSLTGATALELGERGPGRLVSHFLLGLERQQRDEPQAAAALVPHTVGLLESVLDWATRSTPAGNSAAALAREGIHRFVRQHIQDRQLDAASVAAACGLSRRSLFRALEDDGESLTPLIRRLRIERAGRLLRARPDLPLAVIAAQSGFGGPEQLHRAFQSVLGTTPGTYRAMAASDGDKRATAPNPSSSPGPATTDSEAGERSDIHP